MNNEICETLPVPQFTVGDRVRYNYNEHIGFTGKVTEVAPATCGGKFSSWFLVVQPEINLENLQQGLCGLIASPETEFVLQQ